MVSTLLSRLAETWGCPDGIDAGELAPKPINAATLINMEIIARAGRQFVRATTHDTFSELFENIELPGDVDPQPEANTSQQDMAYFDARFNALQQSIDARFDTAQHSIDALRQDFDSLSVWLHRRFPDPP